MNNVLLDALSRLTVEKYFSRSKCSATFLMQEFWFLFIFHGSNIYVVNNSIHLLTLIVVGMTKSFLTFYSREHTKINSITFL